MERRERERREEKSTDRRCINIDFIPIRAGIGIEGEEEEEEDRLLGGRKW